MSTRHTKQRHQIYNFKKTVTPWLTPSTQSGCNLTTCSPDVAHFYIFIGPLGHTYGPQNTWSYPVSKMKFWATSGSVSTFQNPNLVQFMNSGTHLAQIALASAITEPYVPKIAQIRPKCVCCLGTIVAQSVWQRTNTKSLNSLSVEHTHTYKHTHTVADPLTVSNIWSDDLSLMYLLSEL